MITIIIDGIEVSATEGTSILSAALGGGIYIPHLCYHPDLPPVRELAPAEFVYRGESKIENQRPDLKYEGCELCVVNIEGTDGFQRACITTVEDGMRVTTISPELENHRQERLMFLHAKHPHSCLTCAQKEGCARFPCSMNCTEEERCCALFGKCEFQKLSEYIKLKPETPRYVFQDLPRFKQDPLYDRNYNLCVGCTRCVRVCRDVRGIAAVDFIFDQEGRVVIGTVNPSLKDSACRFCTACVAVCPTGTLMDKGVQPRKNEGDLVPCRTTCPVHIDVPVYLHLITQGKREEANAVIREKVPFPGVLGRICTHPCEEVCRRGELNEPISICALKRYAADGDQERWKKNMIISADTGKQVAVVGSGPAGLTAAFYLKKQGHRVTIFESRSKPGGMMRYGIPRYRLPEDLLDKEIQAVLDLGIDYQPNKTLGKDFTLERLRQDGYDAIFLGLGAQLSRRIPLEGVDHPDVLWGVDFLIRVAEGEKIALKDRVLVVGGGGVAVDTALTAIRCGARDVTMVCLEKREEMPARKWEVETALAAGVTLINSWGPQRILIESDRITGLELVHCISVYDDQSTFNPSFDKTRQSIEGDQVILALGQAPDLSFLGADQGIRTERGLIVVNEQTFETDSKGVYAGGDVAAVAGTVIHAIAAGRRSASSIDKALGGSGEIDGVLFDRGSPCQYLGPHEAFASLPREKVPELHLEKGHRGFEEISLGYTEEQALREARRCLQCDLRLHLSKPVLPPRKRLWVEMSLEQIEAVPEREGVYQLLDENEKVIYIKGAMNLKQELKDQRELNAKARFFMFEAEEMYAKRESELLQQFMAEHGDMPEGNREIDDLF